MNENTKTPSKLIRTFTKPVYPPVDKPSVSTFYTKLMKTAEKKQEKFYEFSDKELLSEPIKTFLRLRPISFEEVETIRILNENEIFATAPSGSHAERTKNRNEGKYLFNGIFDKSVTQEELFEKMAKPLLEDVFNGENRTVAAYGVTNSGKTHTIYGSVADQGLTPRSIEWLLEKIKGFQTPYQVKPVKFDEVELESPEFVSLETTNSTGPCHYSLWLSAFEMYNEKLFDLMKGQKEPVEIKQADKSCYVDNLTKSRIFTLNEAQKTLNTIFSNRQTHGTKQNDVSSRSHCFIVIQLVHVSSKLRPSDPDFLNTALVSRLMIVDLAGSERNKQTLTSGVRMKEANGINSSLTSLRRIIQEIRSKKSFISFRDSKLTRILESDLSGKGSLSMIITVNPSANFYDETTHVLEFSALASKTETLKRTDTGLRNNKKEKPDNKQKKGMLYEIATRIADRVASSVKKITSSSDKRTRKESNLSTPLPTKNKPEVEPGTDSLIKLKTPNFESVDASPVIRIVQDNDADFKLNSPGFSKLIKPHSRISTQLNTPIHLNSVSPNNGQSFILLDRTLNLPESPSKPSDNQIAVDKIIEEYNVYIEEMKIQMENDHKEEIAVIEERANCKLDMLSKTYEYKFKEMEDEINRLKLKLEKTTSRDVETQTAASEPSPQAEENHVKDDTSKQSTGTQTVTIVHSTKSTQITSEVQDKENIKSILNSTGLKPEFNHPSKATSATTVSTTSTNNSNNATKKKKLYKKQLQV